MWSEITEANGSVILYIRAVGGDAVVLHGVFDDFRVDPSHSVDSVRSHNAQMGHVDFLCASFLDQGHSAQTVIISRVELTDALEGQKCDFFPPLLPEPHPHIHCKTLPQTDEIK